MFSGVFNQAPGYPAYTGTVPPNQTTYNPNQGMQDYTTQGSPYFGMPQYPTYNPIYDPSTQSLAPQFDQQLSGINPDQSGINAFSQSALRTGPSTWANAATAKSYQDQGFANDQLTKNAASSSASAQGNLAIHGGSRSGAGERIATAGNNSLLGQQQGNAASGMSNRSQITTNDEQNRLAQLGQLPGMQMQQAQFQLGKANMGEAARQTDIQNQMASQQSLNQFNMGAYNTAGSIWGANQQANATAASGSSSWLCTAAAKYCGHKWTQDEQRALQMLKKFAKQMRPSSAYFYLLFCNELVTRMERGNARWSDMLKFVRSVATQIVAGDMLGAYERYVQRTRILIAEYWPECSHPAYLREA